MDDLEVYLINLDRSQDRLQFMDKKLRNMNLKYKRISAVDGQSALFSPNEIDDEEANYLYNQIKGDGQVDETERALLENLKAKSKNFPEILASLL